MSIPKILKAHVTRCGRASIICLNDELSQFLYLSLLRDGSRQNCHTRQQRHQLSLAMGVCLGEDGGQLGSCRCDRNPLCRGDVGERIPSGKLESKCSLGSREAKDMGESERVWSRHLIQINQDRDSMRARFGLRLDLNGMNNELTPLIA
ncbi:hypothetical protein [Microvirga arabica]|uniref:hypothetical protein n=1 Tax=Microvirga arabica TaxID=1128671 RepID=UPI001939A48C|nr:hypothetical protein [Microvirga arabica]MBM1174713.1 hypothetical protein [Microvirga arabica]